MRVGLSSNSLIRFFLKKKDSLFLFLFKSSTVLRGMCPPVRLCCLTGLGDFFSSVNWDILFCSYSFNVLIKGLDNPSLGLSSNPTPHRAMHCGNIDLHVLNE